MELGRSLRLIFFYWIGLEPVKIILHCEKTERVTFFCGFYIFQYSEQENQTWLHERKWIVLITKDFITHINFIWKLDLTVAEKQVSRENYMIFFLSILFYFIYFSKTRQVFPYIMSLLSLLIHFFFNDCKLNLKRKNNLWHRTRVSYRVEATITTF